MEGGDRLAPWPWVHHRRSVQNRSRKAAMRSEDTPVLWRLNYHNCLPVPYRTLATLALPSAVGVRRGRADPGGANHSYPRDGDM